MLQGKPLIYYSLQVFNNHPKIKGIVLVGSKDTLSRIRTIVKKYSFSKVHSIVSGGKERMDSVVNGLNCLPEECDEVLIHDGARPFVSKCLIDKVLTALQRHKAAIPGVAVTDTLKYADSMGIVRKTLQRNHAYFVQTPQGLKKEIIPILLKNYRNTKNAYDDAMLIEKNVKVKIVPSSSINFKITTPHDLFIANQHLARSKRIKH